MFKKCLICAERDQYAHIKIQEALSEIASNGNVHKVLKSIKKHPNKQFIDFVLYSFKKEKRTTSKK